MNRLKGIKVKFIFIVTGATLATATVVFWWASQLGSQAAPALPRENQIASMSATIVESARLYGRRPIPTFPIPARYYALILNAFAAPLRRDYPASWDKATIGQVDMVTNTGRRVQITFCGYGKGRLHFRIDGTRCMRGGSLAVDFDEAVLLYEILNAIHRANASGKEPPELAECAHLFQVAKGGGE